MAWKKHPNNWRNVIAMLALLAVGVSCVLYWQHGDSAVLTQTQEVFATGEVAKNVSVESIEEFHTTSALTFFLRWYTYDFDVSYTTKEGRTFRRPLHFESLFFGVSPSSPPMLRYDPSDPKLFALSWIANRISNGWAALAFKWFVGFLWSIACLFFVAGEFQTVEVQNKPKALGRTAGEVLGWSTLAVVLALGGWIAVQVFSDVRQNWDSYVEWGLGIVAALVVLGLIGWLVGRRRSGFYVEFEVTNENQYEQTSQFVEAVHKARVTDDWHHAQESLLRISSRYGCTWPFDALIDALRNGEFGPLSCERVSPARARLNFSPTAGPYGGTECLEELVRAFGHNVTRTSS